MTVGTFEYMSPEQVRAEELDARTDLFSFGLVLYEMATGRRAFAGDSPGTVFEAILNRAPLSPLRINPELPDELEHIISKALEKDRRVRYQSAAELKADLQRLKRDSDSAAVAPVSPPAAAVGAVREPPLRRWWPAITTTAALVAVVALFIVLNTAGLRDRLLPRPAPTPKIESIAVLPLENLSGDPQQEYFADGMTDALIAELGQIGSLRVISRTSVMHYKGTNETLPQIAKELNVDAVIEGSVLRSGDRVRITAQLIGAVPERHLWARNYERDLRDVLTLQGEIARTIADEVKAKVTPDVQARLARARPVKPEAYEAYLKGSHALQSIGGRAAWGIQYFRDAIAADPAYTPPYVGLCIAYLQMGFGYGPLPPREAFTQTKQAALEALKIDAGLGEAHSCLAWVKSFGEWDWSGGEKSFRLAVELSPNSVHVHRMYAWHLSAMGRFEEAITESHRAIEIDPASLAAGYTAATVYQWARQHDRAAAETERMLQLDPTYPGALIHRALTYLQTGSYDEAIRHFQKAIGDDRPAFPLAWLACAYGRAGERTEALKILNDLQTRSKRTYVSPYLIALIHANVGNSEQALQWLERAYAERNPMLAFLRFDFSLDPLRSDPRFQDLVRRMNFPP
jgi:TolB-like protein/tetratricopeptide (TPR) repeat protein